MAKIVLGVATSHGPMLSTPWQQWGQRVEADKRSSELWFKGKQVTFDELVELRRDEKLENQITPEKMEARHTACQQAIDKLAEVVERVKPDVCVIVGDDQRELFHDTNMPAMAVFWGDKFMNQAPTEEEMARVRNSVDAAMIRSLRSNMGVARMITSVEQTAGDWKYIFKDIEKTKAVTAQQVQEVARKYFTPENRTVGELRPLAPEGGGDDGEPPPQAAQRNLSVEVAR